jgi:hypothetical protein
MKTYQGRREGYACLVTVNDTPLNPRLDLWNHSPNGFEWGYGGSGPAQLALALLADHFGNDDLALEHYHAFKWMVVAELPHTGWSLTSADIERAILVPD